MRRFLTLSQDQQQQAIFACVFLAYWDAQNGVITNNDEHIRAAAVNYGNNLEIYYEDFETVFPTSGPPQPPCK